MSGWVKCFAREVWIRNTVISLGVGEIGQMFYNEESGLVRSLCAFSNFGMSGQD